MWSSDRRTLLAGLAALAGLNACGFSPAHAPGGAGSKLRGQILIDEPQDGEDFLFVSRLEERLGRNTDAMFALSYNLDTDSDGLAITPDQETLRFHLTGTVNYRITNRATGEVLTRGSADNFTAYSAIGTTVATRASENDAERRLMTILADEVVTQLTATAGTWGS